jgi:hypothetical protein
MKPLVCTVDFQDNNSTLVNRRLYESIACRASTSSYVLKIELELLNSWAIVQAARTNVSFYSKKTG